MAKPWPLLFVMDAEQESSSAVELSAWHCLPAANVSAHRLSGADWFNIIGSFDSGF